MNHSSMDALWGPESKSHWRETLPPSARREMECFPVRVRGGAVDQCVEMIVSP